jgi:ATP-binding protein involved in chromosome partitioning
MSVPFSIQHIIAVASGKGGVGKSTTAVNLALSLKQIGQRVGILDADIYGPNLPHLLGSTLSEPLMPSDLQKIQPVIAQGLPSMSIAYLIDERTAAIWRGPMASKAIQQLLQNTDWGPLDYLIVDLPPGTGDIPLTLAQKLSLQGVILVTTPQTIALLDVRKAINMFQKVQVPLVGIIENMGTHRCSQCGQEESLFGQGGATLLAQEYQLPLLGSIPLDVHIHEQADQGIPIVKALPEHPISQAYQTIARALLSNKAKKPKSRFPRIIVE